MTWAIPLILVTALTSQSLAQRPEIVNNPAPNAHSPAFRIAATPVLTIGGDATGDILYELYSAHDPLLTSKGGLIVGNHMESIREYDAKGKFVRTIGRTGSGPGEFRSISELRLIAGDTLVLVDGSQKRITMFGPDGRYMRTISGLRTTRCCTTSGIFLDRARAVPTRGQSIDLTDADWAIGSLRPSKGASRNVQLQTPADVPFQIDFVPHVRFPGDPASIGVTGTRSSTVAGHTVQGGFYSLPMPLVLDPALMLGFGDSTIVVAKGDRFQYEVLASDGRVLRIVRAAAPPLPITAQDVAAARAKFIVTYKDPTLQEALGRAFDSVTKPKTFSPFDRMMVEEDGTVWLRNHLSADSLPRTWARFDRNGRLQGTLRMPPDLGIMRFSRGHVIVRKRDPNADFETLMVFAIIPAK